MRQALISFYLEYVNDYLTVAKMANDHNLTVMHTLALIAIGKQLHEANVKMLKEHRGVQIDA